MPIKHIRDMGVFVVDSFSYRTHIQGYDPLATNQTLISFGEDGGLAVLEDGAAEFLDDEFSQEPEAINTDESDEIAAQAKLAKITPRNADLLRIADRFPAPQEWYDE
jgi:hypothetical protein